MPTVPPAQPQQQQQGPANPEAAIQQIQQGFMSLGKLIQANANQLDPQDIKLFQGAVQAADNLFQALSGPADGAQGKAPAPRSSGGPMPMEANAQARPPSMTY